MSLQSTVQEQVLQRLGKVGVSARQAVESALVGQHRSVHRGLSVEFAGHRPYQPGDDLRRLDWIVYARTDRYDVRLYEEETRLRATLVVDASGSMGYGSGLSNHGVAHVTKLDYARWLAAALGFLMLRQSDAVGLAICDTEVRAHLPPASTMGHFLTVLERLEQREPGGETSLATVLESLAARLSRRGLVILITDAFDDPERLLMALRLLRHRKQDVRIFQIVDPQEERFAFQGMIEFIGLEQEPRLKLDGDRVRSWYQQALSEHRRALAEGCHAINVQLETLRTDEDLAFALVRVLSAAAGKTTGARA
jgi:uncharacterized protein (DUF58 family)